MSLLKSAIQGNGQSTRVVKSRQGDRTIVARVKGEVYQMLVRALMYGLEMGALTKETGYWTGSGRVFKIFTGRVQNDRIRNENIRGSG